MHLIIKNSILICEMWLSGRVVQLRSTNTEAFILQSFHVRELTNINVFGLCWCSYVLSVYININEK